MRTILFACCLFAVVSVRAELIDRIAVTVDKDVITEQQILEHIRVASFLNQEQPSYSADAKRRAADEMVQQILVRREMDFSHYPLPPLSAADQVEEQILERYPNRDAFVESLRRAGLTEEELKSHLWWEVAIVRFVDYRFQPAIDIPNAAVHAAYEKKVAQWKAEGVEPIPGFEESRDSIEKIMLAERADEALNSWLAGAKRRADIEYRKDAFE